MGIEKEVEIWYAMRATYRRELDAIRLLEKEKLGCFRPYEIRNCCQAGKENPCSSSRYTQSGLCPCTSFRGEACQVSGHLSAIHQRPLHRQQNHCSRRANETLIAVAGSYSDHLLYFKPEEVKSEEKAPRCVSRAVNSKGRRVSS